MDNAWENFLEAIAALISKALTNKETEKVIAGFGNFQQRLQRLSRYNGEMMTQDKPHAYFYRYYCYFLFSLCTTWLLIGSGTLSPHLLFSHNLQRLNLEITENAKRVNRCKHEGKTCSQNVTRGFLKTWVVAYLAKYLIAVLPALLKGKVFKKQVRKKKK